MKKIDDDINKYIINIFKETHQTDILVSSWVIIKNNNIETGFPDKFDSTMLEWIMREARYEHFERGYGSKFETALQRLILLYGELVLSDIKKYFNNKSYENPVSELPVIYSRAIEYYSEHLIIEEEIIMVNSIMDLLHNESSNVIDNALLSIDSLCLHDKKYIDTFLPVLKEFLNTCNIKWVQNDIRDMLEDIPTYHTGDETK